ncbi:MAG: dTDP-4-amino-4,6-dideoxygalactose transaminase [Tepidisphaeraceae bacterium]|jgi:dTDP-4-amino-4,6-dideoxygalactose transaminase
MKQPEGPNSLVPFNRPSLIGKEFAYMAEALEEMHISGDGEFSKRCHARLEQVLSVPRALLTTSCTHALEMIALLLNVQPGCEVIVPSFAFASIANAFALRGAKIVFADVRPDTMNIDESKLPGLITGRTRAVAVVHYAGVGCEMDPIVSICQDHGIVLVEDNAHGLFGKYRGQLLGTFGLMSALSFHETKNLIAGEGGAILLNDPALIERAEIIREKGTNRARFHRGEIDKYTWVDLGSSYLPSDLLAAFLFAQLECWQRIQSLREAVWRRYHWALQDWAAQNGVTRPVVPEHCQQAYHMYYLVMPSRQARDGLIEFLKARGIHAAFHYQPLHLSRMGHQYGGRAGDCPVSEDVSERLVRLPFFNSLSPHEQSRVTNSVCAFNCPPRDHLAPSPACGDKLSRHAPLRQP